MSIHAVANLRTTIDHYLRRHQISFEIDRDGDFALRQGSTKVFLRPLRWGDDQTIVKLFAPVAVNISHISLELTRFLLEENHNVLFGKFSLDFAHRAIWFEHVLLGDSLDADELLSAIISIAVTADKYDNQVAKYTGGSTFL
ncbi:MAG: hypothetical protein EI684_01850 [Candidatus Viridilinea halotolerans]|uniref:TY-Chap central domain-containing protein n=1 Tax=Candidatus Viridilinea halotolerans TaxID=2491704 RepID=A0A426U9R0_9CHLR|nr:MAG: hypothetical protein EI684_01850 [Candidatus Viridilinea halotolerans]